MNIVNVGYASTNYYILADARPRLLVDVGWPGTLATLRHRCQRTGIALADVPYLLVTHYHPDHAGLAQEVKGTGSRLIVLDTQRAAIPQLPTYMKPEHHYQAIDLTDNILLRCEESRPFLARIGVLGEIIPTPGHSADSVTLVLDEGAAFTGDLTHPLLLPDDPQDPAQQSWAALRARHVTTIYPGHGPVWRLE
jgi:glyoxylase-like metal-dependent hydrolase (beta-lactamase superfamily II)